MSRMIRLAVLLALALPVAAQQVDSPLVALAKRTGRLGKVPVHVITNEEVAAARGRVSWAGYDSEPAQTQASDANAAAKPASANKAPAVTDWVILEQERANRLERDARNKQAAPPPPQSEGTARASYTQMQSSASNATVSSSASNATPYSTAQPTQVRSTAISSTADQTAPASNPQPVQPRKVD
jgi:hypothetical protein